MGRRRKNPDLFAADVRRAARGFKGASTLSRRIGYDVKAIRKIREIVAKNNARAWASDGAAIGKRWAGQKAGNTVLNDAVVTGKLREYATKPHLLKPRISAKRIKMNVNKSKVRYVKWLGAIVMGWTSSSSKELADMITMRLVAEAESGLG